MVEGQGSGFAAAALEMSCAEDRERYGVALSALGVCRTDDFFANNGLMRKRSSSLGPRRATWAGESGTRKSSSLEERGNFGCTDGDADAIVIGGGPCRGRRTACPDRAGGGGSTTEIVATAAAIGTSGFFMISTRGRGGTTETCRGGRSSGNGDGSRRGAFLGAFRFAGAAGAGARFGADFFGCFADGFLAALFLAAAFAAGFWRTAAAPRSFAFGLTLVTHLRVEGFAVDFLVAVGFFAHSFATFLPAFFGGGFFTGAFFGGIPVPLLCVCCHA